MGRGRRGPTGWRPASASTRTRAGPKPDRLARDDGVPIVRRSPSRREPLLSPLWTGRELAFANADGAATRAAIPPRVGV